MQQFKDEEFLKELEELKHLISCIYISQIDADPKMFFRFFVQLGKMQGMMATRLFQRLWDEYNAPSDP